MDDIRTVYRNGVNVIQHLTQQGYTRKDAIELSYDLQAGTYIEYNAKHARLVAEYTGEMAEEIRGLGTLGSLLEVGCGEATTLTPLLSQLPAMTGFGFDLSWSRARFGLRYATSRLTTAPTLFMGDLFDIPFPDHSIDLVYSYHSLEPNGGDEEVVLRELYRVARRYVLLFEPAFELADAEGRARMDRLGYVKGLRETAERLGYRVLDHRRTRISKNPLNPTGLLLLEKEDGAETGAAVFRCPHSQRPLSRDGSVYASLDGLYVYPIVDQIPCIIRRHAIVATHFGEFRNDTALEFSLKQPLLGPQSPVQV